jgi:hypothetical protein
MRRTGPALVTLIAIVAGSDCYQDALDPTGGLAPVSVLLTDSPFPGGLVDRVEVYVSQIAASMTADTLPAEQRWLIIAEPRQRFELLALQRAATAGAGVGQLETGVYHALRITMNGDSSRVVLHDGRTARVRWPATGTFLVPAVVERPLAVAADGVTLVLDLDVGRSFAYNVDPLFDFVFVPALRAVRADSTGGLAGTVRADSGGGGAPQPMADAVVTAFRGNALATAATWTVVASARSDATGAYRIGFLTPGAYIVQFETPWSATFTSLTMPAVLVVVGAESRLDATLSGAPAGGRAP